MVTAAKKKPVTKPPAKKAGGRVKLNDNVVPISGRVKLNPVADAASTYFTSDKSESGLEFFSTGCVGLDEALGGGWVLGRVSNIVGDRSAGKTLLAIEAAANFKMTYPDGHIRYGESEAAFDEAYAEAMGMPIEAVEFNPEGKALKTVEEFFNDLRRVMRENKGKRILYILDSLDALSDDAEAKRDIDEGSYSMTKQKKLSELFRRAVQEIEESQLHLMIISQIRDKIGVTFGETKTRSGGKALDFYCTHILWLHEIGKIKKTIDKVERVTGINVKAKVKKNKVGLPFREFTYPVLFGYGIDDLMASCDWLVEVGKSERLADVDMSTAGYKVRVGNLRNKGGSEVRETREKLRAIIQKEWREIDRKFLPRAGKYS